MIKHVVIVYHTIPHTFGAFIKGKVQHFAKFLDLLSLPELDSLESKYLILHYIY